jgi:hypothetical protein
MKRSVRVVESVMQVEENEGDPSAMIGLELSGETRGEKLGDGAYSLDRIEVEIDGHQVRLWDAGATGDVDASEGRLADWFDSQLLAHSALTGLATQVIWTGRTIHLANGRTLVGARLHMPFRLGGADPAPFGSHGSVALAIRSRSELRAAAGSLRAAFGVIDHDGIAACGHAYRAVEALVVGQTDKQDLSAWRNLARALHPADPEITGTFMVELNASCQYRRHVRVTWAKRHFPVGGPLNPLQCCLLAAQILQAYVRAARSGDLVASTG